MLSHFDWTVESGEHWAVTGPNGAGKTSLIEALVGKAAVVGGEIRYGGPLSTAPGSPLGIAPQALAAVTTNAWHTLAKSSIQYYQQRFTSLDSERSPEVAEILREALPAEKRLWETAAQLDIETLLG